MRWLTLVLGLTAFPAGAETCRLALVLAIDVSRSVDDKDYALQTDGLIAALEDTAVRRAFFDASGEVALAIYYWSGTSHQQPVLDWTRILALVVRFCDGLWLADGLARNTLESYGRDVTAFSAWLAASGGPGLLGAGAAVIHRPTSRGRWASARRARAAPRGWFPRCAASTASPPGKACARTIPWRASSRQSLPRELPKSLTQADVEAARKEGATDREIHDTVLITAAFCMFNRYVDGLATWAPKTNEAFRELGEKMAHEGYMTPYRPSHRLSGFIAHGVACYAQPSSFIGRTSTLP